MGTTLRTVIGESYSTIMLFLVFIILYLVYQTRKTRYSAPIRKNSIDIDETTALILSLIAALVTSHVLFKN